MTVDTGAPLDTARPEGAGEIDEAKIWSDLMADEVKAADKPEGESAAAAAFAAAASGTADVKTETTEQPAAPADEAGKAPEGKDDKSAAADKPQDSKPADAATDKPDPWANATLTPEQKAALDADRARLAELEHREKTHRGRLSAQDRELARLRSRPAARAAAGDDKPVEKIDPLKLVQDDPDFQQLEKELPEVAGPMGKILVRLADRMQKSIEPMRAQVSTIETERTEAFLQEQDRIVRDKHDDYDAIIQSDDGKKAFTAWYETAPPYMKAAVERNANRVVDGYEVVDIVARFKSDTGWKRPASTAAPAADPPIAATPPSPPPQKAPDTDSVRRELQVASATSPRTSSGSQVAKPETDDPKAIWDEFREMERREAASR